ncbi:hypothetical protein HII13_003100 [Brettanomyces bruxellensis]|uniref:Uncharacterized protein n=1 Tax=Dekkera bruxellensis TaxID=5007 RepID=A0A8H6EU12_DEKBR|nr:uncharacterized protein BRETT_001007 [Brettanomyces bruxellensis]KAF6010326.1 hypothetical protein HII13_003100 [Brettanomyces bruxellensis]KAF6014818.1 hypothetical protein HII12_001235 [Brettanomyces bruxellensis]QOU21286.1 hypothetical protein BRETT_001007 [Brettanomyces bruxellensis]
MAGTAVKFFGGVLLAAVPVLLTTYLARPTFANAIGSRLSQEEEIRKKNEDAKYDTDKYNMNVKNDKLMKNFVKRGDGKARDEYKDLVH